MSSKKQTFSAKKNSATQNAPAKLPGKATDNLKTIDEFRAMFDMREKVREGLRRLGSKHYMVDSKFRELCGVPQNRWRSTVMIPEFVPYRLTYQKITYWACPEMIEEMSNSLGRN